MTKNYKSQNLPDADFRYQDLQNAEFRWAYLHKADFSGANLRGADFSDTDLREADFRGADVTGAVFDRATIDGILFDEVFPIDSDRVPKRKFIVTLRRVIEEEVEINALDEDHAEAEAADYAVGCLDYSSEWEVNKVLEVA